MDWFLEIWWILTTMALAASHLYSWICFRGLIVYLKPRYHERYSYLTYSSGGIDILHLYPYLNSNEDNDDPEIVRLKNMAKQSLSMLFKTFMASMILGLALLVVYVLHGWDKAQEVRAGLIPAMYFKIAVPMFITTTLASVVYIMVTLSRLKNYLILNHTHTWGELKAVGTGLRLIIYSFKKEDNQDYKLVSLKAAVVRAVWCLPSCLGALVTTYAMYLFLGIDRTW